MFVIDFLDRGGEIMLDDCFAEKNSAVCDFFPTYNQIYTAKWKNVPKYRALHQGYNTEE